MVVTLHSTIHNCSIALLSDAFLCDFVVNPIGVAPHGAINLAKFHRRTGVVLDSIFEGIVEVAIVQEYVGIVVPAVEVSLDRFHGFNNTIQLLVPREDDEGGICPRAVCFDGETTGGENLVMLLTDLPVSWK